MLIKVFKIKYSQTIPKITTMVNNGGSKNKCWWLIKKTKSPNSGLRVSEIDKMSSDNLPGQ